MKEYWGNGIIVPRITDLSTRWRWVVSFTLRSLYPQGKTPLVTHWLGGWMGLRADLDAVVKRKIPSPFQDSNSHYPVRSPTLYHWAIPVPVYRYFIFNKNLYNLDVEIVVAYVGIFLFTTASRTALGPTQPPVQWIPGSLSLGLKRPGHEADHSLPSSAEVKDGVELYFRSPSTPPWRGAQLKAQGQLYL
jgi:hypothetical protein